MAVRIAVDDRLETAVLAYPFKAGWLDTTDARLVPHLVPAQARDAAIAVVDSIAAITLLSSHVIVRDVAIASRRASMLTLETFTRPDDVEDAVVSIAGVSPAGRAVSTAVLQPFYGIRVSEWMEQDHAVDEAHARVMEGAEALIPVDSDTIYQEDLGRAWFLMTDRPYVSHVTVAARSLLATDPGRVAAAVERLAEARSIATERGRELRRDLSKSLGIDRETLTETLADQVTVLDDDAIAGLAELARRSGFATSQRELQAAAISVRHGAE